MRYVPPVSRLPAALLAVALFSVYAAGACPTIYVGDSGELVAAVHVLGVPHPTGYPLYVLLGKLWSLAVPLGSIAYRMSLFSAACAALAGALVYQVGRQLALAPSAALCAALLFAFSPSFWGEATVQRVYALNALFVALATLCAVRWQMRNEPRWLVATALVCGLGAANHTFMALYAVAFALAAAARVAVLAWRVGPAVAVSQAGVRWGGRSPLAGSLRTLAAAAAALTVGLLPYAYLPLSSRRDPPLDWGDPETLDRLLAVVLRRGFWERAWVESPADLLIVARDYLHSFGAELTWAGAALALVGLCAGRRFAWLRLLGGLMMLANLAAMAAHGSRTDLFVWHRYYIPSYLMAALLAGCGVQVLVAARPAFLRLAPLALPALLFVNGWGAFDRSGYRIADAYSRSALASLPPGASLIATDDNILFVLMYLTMVEGLRPDVQLILQGVGNAALPPLRFNPDSEPVFFTHHPNWNQPDLEIVPVGLLFQARRAGAPPPSAAPLPAALPGEDSPRVPKDHLTQNLIGQFHYMRGFTLERSDWLQARAAFARAAAAAPDNDVLFYNLGLIYQRNGLLDDARAAFARAQAISPRTVASSGGVRAADRLVEIETERARLAFLMQALAGDPSLAGLAPQSAAYHDRLAALLEARGEPVAARGQRRLARERDGA